MHVGPQEEPSSSRCILAEDDLSSERRTRPCLDGMVRSVVHDAQADGSQDQAFACDHTCVIPINIGRHRYSRATGCTQVISRQVSRVHAEPTY